MNRRRLLAVLGTSAFGGCLDRPVTDFAADRTTRTAGPSNGDALQRISVASTGEIPSKYAVSVTVDVTERTVTTDHTASLRFTLTNDSDSAILVESGRRKAFGAFYSEGDAPKLLLASPDWSLEKVSERCWRPKGDVKPTDVVASYRLPAGESVTLDVEVWDLSADGEPCLQTGTYRFEHEYYLGPDGSSSEFTWGFDLSVERP